ncbi:MAG: hypothetical protein KJZ47_08975 [Gemmatimonadales bacterium]|nr:hypothetical protein [Gemmatimonadales bacterium]
MLYIPVHDLRRIVASLEGLTGREVRDAHLRSDLRQLKVVLADGGILVIAAALDDAGHPYLEVDMVRPPEEVAVDQFEVGFDAS